MESKERKRKSNYKWYHILQKRKAILTAMTLDGVMDEEGSVKKEYLREQGFRGGWVSFNAMRFLEWTNDAYCTIAESRCLHKYAVLFLPGLTKVNMEEARNEWRRENNERSNFKRRVSNRQSELERERKEMFEDVEEWYVSRYPFDVDWKNKRVVLHESVYIAWLKKKLLDPVFAQKFVDKYTIWPDYKYNGMIEYNMNGGVEKFCSIMKKHGIVLYRREHPVGSLLSSRPLSHNHFLSGLKNKAARTGKDMRWKFQLARRGYKLYLIMK